MTHMRILIASDTYYPHVNGASYFTQRLAFYLAERGHVVLVIAPATRFAFETHTVQNVRLFGVRSVPILAYEGFRAAVPLVSKAVIAIARRQHIPVVGTNHFMPDNLVPYFHAPRFVTRSPLGGRAPATLQRWQSMR
jgi:1,2-diacylglycerol 3-alpha-glucosyltransferase